MNRFVLVLIACGVLFFGLLFFNKKDDAGAPSVQASTSNHTQGNGPVKLVEYGDFQCPFCGTFYPVLKQVKEKYGDKITFQFRNFPIASSHPNAVAAHRAAEAADKQGKFFEMHDLLYESQTNWSSSTNAAGIFEGYAKQLGLNVEQFKTDAASSVVNDIIQADISAGKDLRVSGTPTFFLDDLKLESPRDNLEYFSEQIDAALKAKNL
ncbi:thioredoxin domain-containing protein [Candidatus Saccharibacteria bacterium]|nr:thioredoxin domain-containing protein [Candidatus Saccharibacteria bacterium]